MPQDFYFDTSIWLDFFEDRDEPNFPKSEWTHQLLIKITKNNDKVIYSDSVLFELNVAGYSTYEIDSIFKPIRPILILQDIIKPKKPQDIIWI